ncbi:MAG: ATP-binding cassette domain-containing protein [Pseudomonadales bacterium]|nr:ATP-binding cassette domain-containing protein [Pseudomonadales bacterium]
MLTSANNNNLNNSDSPAIDAIHIRGLRKSFGSVEVLKGIDLTAKKGDVIAIIGGSGSGKSTLLRCINLLEIPCAGDVSIGGETIKMKQTSEGPVPADKHQVRRLRASLAMVFQNFNLWQHMSVLENLIAAPTLVQGMPKAAAIDLAKQLLTRVGLSDKQDTYPAFLSGGQQQRVAIARALAVQPDVMLFDEPTSALDPELVGDVLKVIEDLAREGRTMLLVTHEMKFAREVASHVVFLHQGLIEEQGPPEAIFGNPQSERLQQFIRTVQ